MGKREIEKYILKNKENMYRIRKELFENPEIGLKENMASELLAAMFREEGFSVIKGIYGLETGFRAEYADSGQSTQAAGQVPQLRSSANMMHCRRSGMPADII